MPRLREIVRFLEAFAPKSLAEDWDNVGLLVGDADAEIRRIVTCLTVAPPVVKEAVAGEADLIVSHHPCPFNSLKRITADTTTGRMLLDLIRSGIAVYSPHTAFDSAKTGINQLLAEGLELREIGPLIEGEEGGGSGRIGRLSPPVSLGHILARVKAFLEIETAAYVGPLDLPVERVATACGAADSFLDEAVAAGCQCMVTGESRFHTCLEAEAQGVGLIMPGHFASERFAVEYLAEELAGTFRDVEVWAARERDPVRLG
jgi:dinuclear metal center YbgI/SA1388 family protein